jgi:hypothetical protein
MRKAKLCWSDSISGFRRSGLEGVENSHGEVAKSREDLGRRIWGKYEGPIALDMVKLKADMTVMVCWIKRTQSTTKTPFRSFAGQEIGER